MGRVWTATVTITVHDANHEPVPGAVVLGTWTGAWSGSALCTTDERGECSVTSGEIPKRDRATTFTLDGVIAGTGLYDPGSNHDPDGESDGTSITISKPGGDDD